MLLNSVYQTCTQEKLINQNNRNQWLSISDASHALTYSTALLQFQDWRVGTNLRKSYRIVPLLKYPKIPHRQECVWKTLNKVYPLKKDKNIGIQGPVNAEQEGASPCRWGIKFQAKFPLTEDWQVLHILDSQSWEHKQVWRRLTLLIWFSPLV